jgi:molybdopterin-guanine dinucleotide biosynthesis protein A
MGADKAFIEVGGVSMIERVVAALEPLTDRIVLVTSGPDERPNAILDLYPGAGPVGGIVTGLQALGAGLHLVAACDMPELQAAVLALLQESCRDGFDAVVPVVGGRPEPLCALYSASAEQPLRAFLEEGGRAAHQALERLRVRWICEEALRAVDPRLATFININTPDDLIRHRSRISGENGLR